MPPEIPDEANVEFEEIGDGAFTKRIIRYYGKAGSDVAQDRWEGTDPDTGTQIVTEMITTQCSCGASSVQKEDIWRCTVDHCENRICPKCQIRWSRRSYCPGCAERKWALDKRMFYALWFLDEEVTAFEDLIDVDTQDETPVEIRVDAAAPVLQERGYIEDDGSLSPSGQEALSVGKTLYEDDADVERVENKLRFQEVANQR